MFYLDSTCEIHIAPFLVPCHAEPRRAFLVPPREAATQRSSCEIPAVRFLPGGGHSPLERAAPAPAAAVLPEAGPEAGPLQRRRRLRSRPRAPLNISDTTGRDKRHDLVRRGRGGGAREVAG